MPQTPNKQSLFESLSHSQIAPGTRIRCRDEDWLVRKRDRTSSGIVRYAVVGLSPLVQNREAVFLADLESDLKVIDPAETQPTVDDSSQYRDTRLHLEFLLRSTAPSDPRLRLGHKGAMDAVDYQLDPAFIALQQPRQRILIADAVGLGKTIECGILLSELIRRGKGRRILVLTVKSMMTQFQKELWARFTIPLVRLDSEKIARIRTEIPSNHNPFHYYDRTIISIDTIKQDGEYRNHLENAWWDIIVVDEAHNIAKRSGNSQRNRVAERLAGRSDSLLLLSATPHDGRKESFASIMNMLDPTAIKDEQDYGPEDIKGLYVRRFKKDILDQVKGAFPERITHTIKEAAGPGEEQAFETLSNLQFTSIDQKRNSGNLLFKTLLEKALFSSPAACIETVEKRLKNISKRDEAARFTADTTALQNLRADVANIAPKDFARYRVLQDLLSPKSERSIGWDRKDTSDRLVIFTERIATLHWLRDNLSIDLKLKEKEVAILHGAMSDRGQNAIVEEFGQEKSPLRLLIASDVASEGINLHHLSHRLIHFDIPWSLLTFQQRNGRIDRYGQENAPQIHYLLTESAHPTVRGDLRILEILVEKDDQVHHNIGDPSEFTGLHSIEDEEKAIGQAIQNETTPEEFDADYGSEENSATDDPFLAALLAEMPGAGRSGSEDTQISTEKTAESPSLFPDEFAWAKAAFDFAKQRLAEPLHYETVEDKQEIHLQLPSDLKKRLKRLPTEIRPPDGQWVLTTDRKAIEKEIDACRKEEGRWPIVQLLWQLHPAMCWLEDKILAAFGRSDSPIVQLESLAPGQTIVLGYGLIPNRKGHPLIQRWAGIEFKDGAFVSTMTMEEVLEITRFNQPNSTPNKTANLPDPADFNPLIRPAVDQIRQLLTAARREFDDTVADELIAQLDRLEAFRDARLAQLKLIFEEREHRAAQEKRGVEDLHEAYCTWIKDTLETEDNSSIRIAAIFTSSKMPALTI